MTHLSPYQFVVLKHIARGKLTLEGARTLKDSTLYSLSYRGYIEVHAGTVLLTPEGYSALETYNKAELPERKTESPLTDRTNRLLKLVRMRAA